MRFSNVVRSAAIALLSLAFVMPAVAWSKNGDVLLRELRDQVEIQRQTMSPEQLQAAADNMDRLLVSAGKPRMVECSSRVVAAILADRAKLIGRHMEYIYNAVYEQLIVAVGKDACVYMKQPAERSLTIDEARDLVVAHHLSFPRYVPSAGDQADAEEQFFSLRREAKLLRGDMNPQDQRRVESYLDYYVDCSDESLIPHSIFEEQPGIEPSEVINGEIYVWAPYWIETSLDGPGFCAFVRFPIHRGLTVDEARDLLTVTETEFPSMDGVIPKGGWPRAGANNGHPKHSSPVPNLQATAGSMTSQIQWSSSIDGPLGTGGDVPVAGRLSPGHHVITATLPASSQKVVSDDGTVQTVPTKEVVASVSIFVNGGESTTLDADPEIVVVPDGLTTAKTKISWTVARGTSGTNVAYSLNEAPIVVWKEEQVAGTDAFDIHPGDSVVFYSYKPGSRYTEGKTVTVTGKTARP